MQIHQLSITYDPAQDRLLARINTKEGEEIRVWLTRRLCLDLWPALNKSVAEHVAQQKGLQGETASPMGHADDLTKQMMAEFDRHDALQKADFKTPYKAQANLLPLGMEPLVVTQMQLQTLKSGHLQLAFKEKLPGQPASRDFQVDFSLKTLHAFVHLLDKALQRSGWLGGASGDAARVMPVAAPEKPKYLN